MLKLCHIDKINFKFKVYQILFTFFVIFFNIQLKIGTYHGEGQEHSLYNNTNSSNNKYCGVHTNDFNLT